MRTKFLPYMLLVQGIPRLIGLNSASIWYDEGFSILAARLPLGTMLNLLKIDFTPPLWEMVIHPVAGGPLWLVRLVVFAFSLGAAWLAWEIAGHKQPLLFTALALVPGLLWHAQDARSYALLSFLYLLAGYMAIKGRWLGLAASCGLILWTHATGAGFVAGALALGLYSHPKKWKVVILCGAGAAVSYLPWVPSWLQNGMTGHWIPPLSAEWFLEQTFLAFWVSDLQFFYMLAFLILLLVSLVAACIRARFAPRTSILFLVPLALLLAVSAFFRDVFMYRTLTPFLLPFGLWLVEISEGKKWLSRVLTAGWSAMLLISLMTWNPASRGAGLEQAADTIRERWQAGDVIFYGTGSVAVPFYYYLPEFPGYLYATERHAGLGKPELMAGFGLPEADLADLEYTRLWLIYPVEMLLTPEQTAYLEGIAQGGELVARLEYLQTAPILVVLVEAP